MATYGGRFKPFDQIVLDEGNRLALGWADDKWTFHTIMGVKRTRVRPFMRGLNLITPGSTQDFTELTDADNNRIFDVTREYADKLMYHAAIGLKPAQLRAYIKYPSGVDLRTVRSHQPVSLTLGYNGQRDYVTSRESPYSRPTNATEMFFPYTLDLTMGFANTDLARPHQVVLNVEMAAYSFKTLDPKRPSHLDIIKKIVKGSIPRRIFSLGFVGSKVKEYALSDFWKVEAVPWDDIDSSIDHTPGPVTQQQNMSGARGPLGLFGGR
jgi:hypothetical protein